MEQWNGGVIELLRVYWDELECCLLSRANHPTPVPDLIIALAAEGNQLLTGVFQHVQTNKLMLKVAELTNHIVGASIVYKLRHKQPPKHLLA